MFPLGGVLLPGEALPLHVFEPRYRRMVDDCLTGDRNLGVVLIERGSEVGGGDARFDVGCLARIADAARLPDGRWAMVVAGVERLRVVEWLPDDPYPLADVERWPDAGEEDPALVDTVLADLRRVLAMAAELGDPVPPVPDAVSASWALVSSAPIGPLDRLALLRADGPAERLEHLASLLAEEEAVLAARLGGG
jgi:Lon protease-like protein